MYLLGVINEDLTQRICIATKDMNSDGTVKLPCMPIPTVPRKISGTVQFHNS